MDNGAHHAGFFGAVMKGEQNKKGGRREKKRNVQRVPIIARVGEGLD